MDLVEKLKRINGLVAIQDDDPDYDYEIAWQAADEIERLRKEVDELKDLMQATVNYTGASVSSTNYTFHAALQQKESK